MELRKDYILDRWVVIAERRKIRPREFQRREESSAQARCIFCPGNESLTPPEKGRIGQPWQVRWFDNLFAFAERQGTPAIKTDNEFFTFGNPYGVHEIVVDTPRHDADIWDLSQPELLLLFDAYKRRILELSALPDTKWVSVFKNHGHEGGASIQHAHSQVVSFNIAPLHVEHEIAAAKSHAGCAYCRIIDIERRSDRRVRESAHFVSFTPYASRFNFELWIFARQCGRSFTDFTEEERVDLIAHLHAAMQTLRAQGLAFNYFFHYPPAGESLHFHIEITPRAAIWAGFELSTGIIINSVSPEYAARVFRGEA